MTMESEVRPSLRPVEITPFEADGQEWLYFHDPAGYSPDAQVPRGFVPVLKLMDGTRSVVEIALELSDRTGQDIEVAWVEKLVSELEALYLLDSPVFWALRDNLQAQFLTDTVRPAAFAGRSYPAEPAELSGYLDELLEKGKKLLPPPALLAYEPAMVEGVVVPHIDFGRGGPEEALAYVPLMENVAATGRAFDTLVVLGIAHSGVSYPFCAAPKDFATPLGTAGCDWEFLRDLDDRLGPRLTAEHYLHKNEHSLEFVAVMTQGFEPLKETRLVPIACGGFWEPLRTGQSPSGDADISAFITALRQVTQEHRARGKKVGFVASVDGAHVGSHFGDERLLDGRRLDEIRYADRAWCAAIEAGDAEALHAHFARDRNQFNVDAYPALYALLAAFPELRGQLLAYNQAYNEEANSVVSFATLALFQP